MAKTFKEKPTFKKTKKPKKGAFWGEGKKKDFEEDLLREEER